MSARGFVVVALAIIAALFALGLAGCVAAGSAGDPAANLLAQNVAVRKICADLLDRNRLSAENGQRCLMVTNEVRDSIDLYRLGSLDSLQDAQDALTALERRLQDEGGAR